jgi:hypothetical protein
MTEKKIKKSTQSKWSNVRFYFGQVVFMFHYNVSHCSKCKSELRPMRAMQVLLFKTNKAMYVLC